MKKVKSIGKKVMSVGLAASLLLAPVGANNCCFAVWGKGSQAQQKGFNAYEVSAEIVAGLTVISLIIFLGLENKEAITSFFEANKSEMVRELGFIKDIGVRTATDIGTFIKSLLEFAKYLGEDIFEIGDSVYRILERIGFKNIFAAIGGLYLTNKLYNGTKWVYNKVAGLFSSKKNEQENKDNKGKPKQTGNINVNNVNVNNLNMNNLDEDWLNNNRDKLRKVLGMQN